MPASSPAAALIGELDALHRNVVFPTMFQQISWPIVAAYECEISRKDGVIHVHKSTFWLSADKDPNLAVTISFADSSDEIGGHITHDAFTEACQTPGNARFVIGCAPTEQQANAAIRRHRRKNGGKCLLVDNLGDGDAVPSPRATRSARRLQKRGRM